MTLCFLAAGAALGQTDAGTRMTYTGTLGTARIGLTIITKDNSISGGHYFYARYLTDISLTGSLAPGGLNLQGSDGGSFALKFVGNGSEGGKPLNFENSVGLEGSWSSKDGKSLPVKLTMSGQSPAGPRWYADITSESDSAFEVHVQGFYKAVLAGDRAAAAKYVAFPLRVNHNGKSRTLHNAAELSAQWDSIFTPAYIAAIRQALPHDLSVIQGQAMLGDGQVYFNEKGATVLNLP